MKNAAYEVIDEMLVSEAFTPQNQYAALDMAQRVLNLASKGEHDAQNIKRDIENLLSAPAAA